MLSPPQFYCLFHSIELFYNIVDKENICIYFCYVSYIHFSWDDSKNNANIRKHGISFEEASTVFFDDNARLLHDPDHSRNENRFILLGLSRKFRLLLVCHCYRQNEEQIRIISARKATNSESSQSGR